MRHAIDEKAMLWAVEQISTDVIHREENTPDHTQLSSYQHNLLFLPCEFREGQSRHGLVQSGLQKERTAYTEQNFFFWKYDRGNMSYPIPLEADIPMPHKPVWSDRADGPMPTRIAGDLFSVLDPRVIYTLDGIRDNGLTFVRKRVPLLLRSRQLKYFTSRDNIPIDELDPISTNLGVSGWFTEKIKAWMYVGVPAYWENLIDGGHMFPPVARFEPNDQWTPSYYLYRENG